MLVHSERIFHPQNMLLTAGFVQVWSSSKSLEICKLVFQVTRVKVRKIKIKSGKKEQVFNC